MGNLKFKPDFIYHGNKPIAVVLKINDYEKILDDLEDAEDIQNLKEIREKGIQTTDFDEYLSSRGINV
jgi:hypothetical protein